MDRPEQHLVPFLGQERHLSTSLSTVHTSSVDLKLAASIIVVTHMVSVVFLIIANEADEHNCRLEKLWRTRLEHYKTTYTTNLDYYFLKARPDIAEDHQLVEHDFYVKTQESIIPGILIKTLKAFAVLSPQYDFTMRCNLSSVVLVHRFMAWLQQQKTSMLYAGVPHPFGSNFMNCRWAFGAGYTISRDVAALLAQDDVINHKVDNGIIKGDWTNVHDDVFVGYVCLYVHKLRLTPYMTIEMFRKEHLNHAVLFAKRAPQVFHLRIKLLNSSNTERLELEPAAHEQLTEEVLSSNSM